MDQKKYRTWIFVVPVDGLRLSQDLSCEYKIDKVTLVTKSRLERVRKRFMFPVVISNISKRHPFVARILDSKSGIYAIVIRTGIVDEILDKVLQDIRNELMMLSLSQLGYSRRRLNSQLCILGESPSRSQSYLVVDTKSGDVSMSANAVSGYSKLTLDSRWMNFQKNVFFFDILNIIRKNYRISSSWYSNIKNACILSGQSQLSKNLPLAFLWNMIALESMLTCDSDKQSEQLPKRVEAFIGWSMEWSVNNFENKLHHAYKKRCNLVHAGTIDQINIEDVYFTDHILLNVFTNISNNIEMFKNKNDLIKFSEKVQAEKHLNINANVRPKSVKYIGLSYSSEDFENAKYWSY